MNLTELLLQSKYPFRELTEQESSSLKLTLLGILKDIIEICQQNNLTVMLVGGSALGAVRHNGFIPWDDDIDVAMPRLDYNRFPSLLVKSFPDKYECLGAGFSDNPELGFIKVQKKGTLLRTVHETEDEKPSIAIDIFPIENVPNNKILRFFHGCSVNVLLYISVCVKLYEKRNCPLTQVLLSDKQGRKSLKRRLFFGKLFGLFFKSSRWYKWSNKKAQKYQNYNTKQVSIPTGRRHYFGEIQERTVFFPPVKHNFEGIESCIPNNSDKYLSALYGDYMQIPPVEKREKHFILEINFSMDDK